MKQKIRITEAQYNRLKQSLIEDCWKGYEQIGMKDKGGKQVPNCVPKTNESKHSYTDDIENTSSNDDAYDKAFDTMNEVSADKVMGAANKMWQDKISGNDRMENPRAKNLLTDYASRLKGTKLAGGEVNFINVDLVSSNNGQAFNLMFMIGVNSGMSFNGREYTGLWYNYSNDRFVIGSQANDNLTPIDQYRESSLTKFDARQLYKIASHFNPKTRYVNYGEIPFYKYEKENINKITKAKP